jgi:hypothetical protein
VALDTPQAGEKCRQFAGAWERLLDFYSPLPTSNTPAVSLPPDLAAMLKGLFGYLSVGQMPQPFAACVASSRTAAGPAERRDIATAVAYLQRAKGLRGKLGQEPMQLVADCYAVNTRTVYDWLNKIPPLGGAECFSDRHLRRMLAAAGQRYQHAGRSRGAVHRRRRK